MTRKIPKQRPVSQPVHLPLAFQSACYSPKRTHSVHPHNYRHLEEVDMPLALASIPEVGFRSSEILAETAPHTLYASCNGGFLFISFSFFFCLKNDVSSKMSCNFLNFFVITSNMHSVIKILS